MSTLPTVQQTALGINRAATTSNVVVHIVIQTPIKPSNRKTSTHCNHNYTTTLVSTIWQTLLTTTLRMTQGRLLSDPCHVLCLHDPAAAPLLRAACAVPAAASPPQEVSQHLPPVCLLLLPQLLLPQLLLLLSPEHARQLMHECCTAAHTSCSCILCMVCALPCRVHIGS
jgi:hypothetical protein